MRRTTGGASNRILEVAGELFAENGYRGTSIEEIAAGAEIGRSSLFWHFGSKEGLLRAVLEDTLGSWVGAVSGDGDERGLAAMRNAVVAMTKVHSEHPAVVRLTTLLMGEASATETSLAPVLVEIEQTLLGLWRRWLSEAAEDGELRPGVDPEKAAAVLNAVSYGTKQLWALRPEHYQISASEDALLHLIDCLSSTGPPARRAGRRRSTQARPAKGNSQPRRTSGTRKVTAK